MNKGTPMKVSLSWLGTYVDLSMDAARLAQELTMTGLEVEAVYDRFAFLDTVLVGRVTAVDPHPQADKLKLCQVQAGERAYGVVCGAPNVKTGMLAPLALPSTELMDGTILTHSTIRGQRSEGMLCSEIELGLGLDASGLMVLDNALIPGTPLNLALNLTDPVLDISLTPNRSDCLSIIGIAREVAGLQGTGIKRPVIQLPETQDDINDHTSVMVQAPDHCPRYAARLMTAIKVRPAPFWLQDRLRSVGLRPINNLVDVTNFVMLETGQPLHAFDFDHLAENRIVVRTAQAGEKFTTLDGKERELSAEMLMICDGQKAVGIGGVMGGLNSEIQESTSRVLLESAYFNPISIRKTAKKLGLNSDAAHRFERGVDPHGTLFAIDRAAALMVQLGEGKLVGGTIDICSKLPKPTAIRLSVPAANRTLGTHLDASQMSELLGAIEFKVSGDGKNELHVEVPSFRVDVSRPEDLMEEVARRWGYDNIPTTFSTIPAVSQTANTLWVQRQLIRERLAGLGFNEAINYSFIHKDSCDRIGLGKDDARRRLIEILNPLSEDQSVLRTSLIPGLLESMQRNLARQAKTLKFFEIGKIFISRGADSLPEESDMLAGLWTGDRTASGWFGKPAACDYYDLKGIVENLFMGLHLPAAGFTKLEASKCTYTRPGISARITLAGREVGIIGEINAKVLDAYNLKQPAFVFEIDFRDLTELIPDSVVAQLLPKYPATARDATLIVDHDIEAQSLIAQVKTMDQSLVEDVHIFDVYRGTPVPENRKSISLRIIYRSAQETLEDETVNQIHKEITDRLVAQFKADLPA
jgi:phenylalanyl-tRNA synthetase beta chain